MSKSITDYVNDADAELANCMSMIKQLTFPSIIRSDMANKNDFNKVYLSETLLEVVQKAKEINDIILSECARLKISSHSSAESILEKIKDLK
jgi:hypothetical protein